MCQWSFIQMLALRYDCYRGYQERAENDIFVFAQPIMSTPGHVLGPLTPALGARVAHKIWNFDPLKQQSTIRYLTMYIKFKWGEVSTDNQLLLGHRNRSTCSRQTMRLYETCWSLDKAWPQYWFINTSSSSTHEPCGVSIEGDRVNNFYLKYVFMLNE